jgi:hypothetical protein
MRSFPKELIRIPAYVPITLHRFFLGSAAALFVVLTLQNCAFAQETEQQRQACTPDVFRLCGAYIPDHDRIAACLRGSGQRLSAPCYAVFFPQQDTAPQRFSSPRQRYDRRLSPPPDDDD